MIVNRKQPNSKKCIICGVDNPYGLAAPFYELSDGSVVTRFRYRELHQSYPGRAHGGMITCMLDELAGRVIWVSEPDAFAVTTTISVKFRKPVPYDAELFGRGIIVSNSRRGFQAIARIFDREGHVLAEADVTYLKLPSATITDADMHEELDVNIPDDVREWPDELVI